jgi:hypothetical protein
MSGAKFGFSRTAAKNKIRPQKDDKDERRNRSKNEHYQEDH